MKIVQNKSCKVCDSESSFLGLVKFEKGHENEDNLLKPKGGSHIPYYGCKSCGFIFTDFFDSWNVPKFRKYIYNQTFFSGDLANDGVPIEGKLRSLSYVNGLRIKILIERFIEAKFLLTNKDEMCILDYGSGGAPGDTAQALLDNNYKVNWYDPYAPESSNLEERVYDVIYLVEVIEHCQNLNQPLDFIDQFLDSKGILIMSTHLHPFPTPNDVLESWYITPRTGHVSIFTMPSIVQLFKRININIVNTGTSLVGKRANSSK